MIFLILSQGGGTEEKLFLYPQVYAYGWELKLTGHKFAREKINFIHVGKWSSQKSVTPGSGLNWGFIDHLNEGEGCPWENKGLLGQISGPEKNRWETGWFCDHVYRWGPFLCSCKSPSFLVGRKKFCPRGAAAWPLNSSGRPCFQADEQVQEKSSFLTTCSSKQSRPQHCILDPFSGDLKKGAFRAVESVDSKVTGDCWNPFPLSRGDLI